MALVNVRSLGCWIDKGPSNFSDLVKTSRFESSSSVPSEKLDDDEDDDDLIPDDGGGDFPFKFVHLERALDGGGDEADDDAGCRLAIEVLEARAAIAGLAISSSSRHVEVFASGECGEYLGTTEGDAFVKIEDLAGGYLYKARFRPFSSKTRTLKALTLKLTGRTDTHVVTSVSVELEIALKSSGAPPPTSLAAPLLHLAAMDPGLAERLTSGLALNSGKSKFNLDRVNEYLGSSRDLTDEAKKFKGLFEAFQASRRGGDQVPTPSLAAFSVLGSTAAEPTAGHMKRPCSKVDPGESHDRPADETANTKVTLRNELCRSCSLNLFARMDKLEERVNQRLDRLEALHRETFEALMRLHGS